MLHWLTECSQYLHERVLHKCLDPNITGTVGWEGSGFANTVTGAFSGSPATAGSPLMTGGGARYAVATFTASDDNAIYAGETVQPSVLQTLVCIKS